MQDSKLDLKSELQKVIAGRRLSLVGNAASLLRQRLGEEIDSGCVIRLNSGIPIHKRAQGRRTDIHCFSTRSSLQYNLGRATWRVRLRRNHFNDKFSVWMSPDDRETAEPGQAFYPMPLCDELTERLGATPSVGAKTLHMLSELTDAEIRVFGYDFKTTTTFYRTKENLGPHNWQGEQDFALSLVRAGRISLAA
ncbi:glycosyltransferase family 29 protein [Falsirhodobacter sp. 1013]|uniref:glycosyltransferase family 29 protein n=1 Tax=Falsirhodobacter sp. 1013 TaxID=3417566 RepID=UPI003EB90CD3